MSLNQEQHDGELVEKEPINRITNQQEELASKNELVSVIREYLQLNIVN